MQNVMLKVAVVATWFFIPFVITAQEQLLLKHGTYVQAATACKDAPFAAMKSWDGVGFGDPHASKCTSRILSHNGSQYKVSTTCTALGDGTPNPSGHADEEILQLTRLSDTSFIVWNDTKTKVTYRWCAAN